ncbi:MAG TPA: hypothetical protein VMY39_01810 [Planctomycetota bacterium]|nr:hypothetical protein [Planctomycetota bacterium]
MRNRFSIESVLAVVVIGVLIVVGGFATAQETQPPIVDPTEVVAFVTEGGIKVVDGAPTVSPNLGVRYDRANGQWEAHVGDVKRLTSLTQPEGAESGLHMARIDKIYREFDNSTSLMKLTPVYAIGFWLPEQFVGVERETAEELRGIFCARLVRADHTWITVLGDEDEIGSRWLACLRRGAMPALFGPTIGGK